VSLVRGPNGRCTADALENTPLVLAKVREHPKEQNKSQSEEGRGPRPEKQAATAQHEEHDSVLRITVLSCEGRSNRARRTLEQ